LQNSCHKLYPQAEIQRPSKPQCNIMSVTDSNISTYPSLSTTGDSRVRCSGLDDAEIISRNWRTAWMCFSVQNALYRADMYSSLHVCCADRQLTKLPRLCIVLEMSVRVRFVWESCKHQTYRTFLPIHCTSFKDLKGSAN
jgi:hypothetical protein